MVARTTLSGLEEALQDADAVVVPAGSCTTMIRVFWAELFELAHDHVSKARAEIVAAKVFELSEFLGSGPSLSRDATKSPPRTDEPVRYHPSCHMLRELGLKDEPVDALRSCGMEVDRGPERCCGFGGLFSVKLPETSVAMADEVLDAAVASGATQVVAADGSCLMQLEARSKARGLSLSFRHLAVAIDDADSR